MPISTVLTRQQLRDRLRRKIRYTGSAGATQDAQLNAELQDAVSEVYEILSSSSDGILDKEIQVTIASGDPNGQVPGERVPLPDDFRRVASLYVNRYPAEVSNPSQVHRLRNDVLQADATYDFYRRYYVSGASQDDAGAIVPEQLELYPAWAEGDIYSLLYVTLPPFLGDPTAPADDAASVDYMMDSVVRAIVARAGIASLSRDDEQGRARLLQEAMRAETEFAEARTQRAGGVRYLRDYDRTRNSSWRRW